MTLHAKVINGAVSSIGGLPSAAQRLDTGAWVSNFDQADQTLREACGWFPVTEVRPALGTDQVYGPPAFVVNAHDVTATYPVVADSAVNIAGRAQDAAVANLLAGAKDLRDRLTTLKADITSAATTYQAAKGTYQTALSALGASPTTAQLATFLKTTQATYLLADNVALTAVGGDLNSTITELDNVVKGLGNFIARQFGSTTVLS